MYSVMACSRTGSGRLSKASISDFRNLPLTPSELSGSSVGTYGCYEISEDDDDASRTLHLQFPQIFNSHKFPINTEKMRMRMRMRMRRRMRRRMSIDIYKECRDLWRRRRPHIRDACV